MDNKEAIKWLEDMKKGLFPWNDEVMKEVCDTAIKALSTYSGPTDEEVEKWLKDRDYSLITNYALNQLLRGR